MDAKDDKDRLLPVLAQSIRDNWPRAALSDFRGQTYTYGDVARRVAQIHMLLRAADIKAGDRVALCAKNSANWAVTFLGIITTGAVVVPLLHEFHTDTLEHLLAHSESRMLFSETSIIKAIDAKKVPSVEGVVNLADFQVAYARRSELKLLGESLDEAFDKVYPHGLAPKDVAVPQRRADELALISYTSGSTGNSKGVMLSYGNLWSNLNFARETLHYMTGDTNMLSMLPLAHMYGLMFEFLYPLSEGCHVTFLGRTPSPRIVLDAFAATQPKLVITVPLVIEKIVRTRIFPQLEKPAMKIALKVPGVRGAILGKIRQKLLQAFGGNLEQLVIGGAALSAPVEEFLRKIKFPFTVGYGMTECAPLVTYEGWQTQRPASCGRLVTGMEARVASPDPTKQPGILSVRGANVMKGYYKNPEETKKVLGEDGWLDTGDICTIDRDGYIYLRGREKNMILGPSGQNIYPEEIETILNTLPLVGESVVVDRNGRLVALVYPDYEAAKAQGLDKEEAERRVKALLPELNAKLPAYERVAEVEIMAQEFEKTPKKSIRRFLYK